MYGFYTPVLILQIVCFYHAYRTGVEQRWYWLILFFPLGGSIIYLAYNFGNRTNLNKIAETVKVAVNSNYQTRQLELAVEHSDNSTNMVNLADAYVNLGRHDEAIGLYLKCLSGFMEDDPVLKSKLLKAYFLKGDFASVVQTGSQLEKEKSFLDSEERAAYAWALHHQGRSKEGKEIFDRLNKPYTNYKQRVEYCKFLNTIGEKELLIELVSEMNSEFKHMKGPERKFHRNVIRIVEDMKYDFSKTN